VPLAIEHGAAIGGFVAAEGTFAATQTGATRAFTFAVGLGAADTSGCLWLHDRFDCGTLHRYDRRRPHYDDEVRFQVRKLRDLVEIVVPFMDEHLPPSYKREQYLVWRAALVDYWEHDARRRRPCTVEGCDGPAVAHGRCHTHDMAWRRQRGRAEREASHSDQHVHGEQ